MNYSITARLFILSAAMLINFSAHTIQAQQNPGIPSEELIIDGSSTSFSVTNAIASYYMKFSDKLKITVNSSGAGDGFVRLAKGEIDINSSSRKPTPDETRLIRQNNIDLIELKIATDGIVVVSNPQNSFAKYLTTDELRNIWSKSSTVTYWSDLRNEWPKKKINLYGPKTNSEARIFFSSQIFEDNEEMRDDYFVNNTEKELANNIINDANALSFVNLSYYQKNSRILNSIAIVAGSGPFGPTHKNMKNRTYQPLSRTFYLHVNKESMNNPLVANFLSSYMLMTQKMAKIAGYVPFPRSLYENQNSVIQYEADKIVLK